MYVSCMYDVCILCMYYRINNPINICTVFKYLNKIYNYQYNIYMYKLNVFIIVTSSSHNYKNKKICIYNIYTIHTQSYIRIEYMHTPTYLHKMLGVCAMSSKFFIPPGAALLIRSRCFRTCSFGPVLR